MPKFANVRRKMVLKPLPSMTPEAQGRRIGALRTALGWSNKELSLQTGISEPTLSHYVHGGKKSISAVDLWRIAKATGVTTDYLIYGDRAHLPSTILKLLPPEVT